MREGPGREEWRLVAAAAGARPRPIGRMRSAAAVALVVLGLGAAAGAFVGLEQATARSVEPLREATAPVDVQRFTFDRTAWRTVQYFRWRWTSARAMCGRGRWAD